MQDNKNKLMNIIGAVIKKHRLAQNKSIYKISAESGISKSVWREVEISASKDINISTLWKISEGLDITLEQLFSEIKANLDKDFSLID